MNDDNTAVQDNNPQPTVPPVNPPPPTPVDSLPPVVPTPPLVTVIKGKEKPEEMVAVKPGGPEHEPLPVVEKRVEAVVEIPTEPELGKETEGYIEKVEKSTELKQPIRDDYTQDVLLKSANPQNAVVTLPLTEEQVKEGLHHKVFESIRWLAEWCVRQVKVLHGKVRYRSESKQ